METVLLLDLGQVLVGADHSRCTKKLAAHTGRSRLEVEDAISSGRLHDDFSLGRFGPEEFWAEVCDRLEVRMSAGMFFDAWNETIYELEQTRSVVSALAQRHALYLLSNTDPLHFEHIRTRCAGWIDELDGCFLSFEEGVIKPDRAFFEGALARFALDARRCLFFDDNVENTESAADVGIASFVVSDGGLSVEFVESALSSVNR